MDDEYQDDYKLNSPNRAPIIGQGRRTHRMEVQFNGSELAALDAQLRARRCQSRQDYLRYLVEADYQGKLLVIDDGFLAMAEAVGRAFGGAAAELTAQADLYRLQKKLGDYE